MNLYIPDAFSGDRAKAVYYQPLERLDERGNPVYDVGRARKMLEGFFKGEFAVWVTGSGEIYVADAEILPPLESGEGREPQWGGTHTGVGSTKDIKLMKFDARGNLLWRTGAKAAREAKPGEAYKVVSIAGVERGFVFFVDVSGQERVYTDDGLYVATLLEDPFEGYFDLPYLEWWERLRTRPGPDLLNVEHFGARVFAHPRSRVTYLMAGSDAIHLWRLEGLERVHRFGRGVASGR